MAWCLTGKVANEFLRRLRSGEINPDRLIEMTSADRNAYFAEFMGKENAAKSNALFESKLLLKNQKKGLVTWAKQTAGLKPEVRRDILARVERMTEILDVREQEAFLNDLANQRLGMSVTLAEANKISDLAKGISEKKSKVREDFTFATEAERMDYGMSVEGFKDYVGKLKAVAERPTLKEYIRHPTRLVSDIAGTAKAVKSSMDDSGLFNQGWKMLTQFSVPGIAPGLQGIWFRNALKSFSDIVKTVGGKNVEAVGNAEIVSRPNSLNGRYRRSGVKTTVIEEEFPMPFPIEKIPVGGRLYKASEVAFTLFARRNRADVTDLYYHIAKRTGQNVNDILLERDIGTLANSLGSRGSLGRLEPVGDITNRVFFSARKWKSDWDLLTGHTAGLGLKTGFARKQAALNTLRLISGSAAVLAVANAVRPGSVDWDPRSANFGKIRIGDTRFDVTGKIAPIATLAARLITNKYKSSTTGRIYDMREGGYGKPTREDMVYDFAANKFSPAASVLRDLARGETFEREKPTVGYEVTNLFEPFTVDLGRELAEDGVTADDAVTLLADALGVTVNIYETFSDNAQKVFRGLDRAEKVEREYKTKQGFEAAQFAQKPENQYWLNRASSLRSLTREMNKAQKAGNKAEVERLAQIGLNIITER